MNEGGNSERLQHRRFKPYLVFTVLLIAGSALSVAAFFHSRSLGEQRVREEFDRASGNRVSAFRRVVVAGINALESLGSFHEASHEVERQEFSSFVKPLLAHNPGIQALEWIPRVPGEQRSAVEQAARDDGHSGFEFKERDARGNMIPAELRSEYFPVYFVEPREGNEIALGFDLASDPIRLAAMRLARESGRATATPRVRLVQESTGQFGLLVFKPVYEGHPGGSGGSGGSGDSRGGTLEGFVLGVFRVGDLLETGLAYLDRREIEFCVIDRSAPEGERFLYSIPARRPGSDADGDAAGSGLRHSETMDVGGREWEVICLPSPGYVAAHRGSLPRWLLVGGILCTGLLSGCVLLILVRVDRTHRHALEILKAKNVLEHEMSERRIVEEQIQLLTTAVEQSTEGMALVDLAGNLLFVNQAFAAMHGYAPEELTGRHISVFHSPDQLPAVEEANRQVLETGEFVGEIGHVRRDGGVFPGEMRNALLRDESGDPIAMVGTLRDITRQKQIEEELQKAERLESIGQLAGGIAHDFNNLLTGVLGNINLARIHCEPGSKAYVRLAEAEKASARAQELTQQLLTFSRGGAPVKETISIGQLVRESADFVLRGSNVLCEYDVPEDLWPADVDEGQMSRVVGNLAINADQAMPDGGVVSVRCANVTLDDGDPIPLAPGKYVRFSMQDRGSGIGAEDLRRVFDPYFTTKKEGSGLGLTSAYSIVKKHGGLITAESAAGSGTLFQVFLPASENSVSASEAPRLDPRIGGARILVVDDEETVRDVAGEMLKLLGCEVVLAAEGAEGVETYLDAKRTGSGFDLVIMDLTLPGGMGGREAFGVLRRSDPDIRAVVSSGYSNDPVLANFRDHGFLGAVAKPYTIEELSAALAEAMSD